VAGGEAGEWGGRRVGSEGKRRHLSLRLAADVTELPICSDFWWHGQDGGRVPPIL